MHAPSRRSALKGAAAFLTGFAAGSIPDAKAASGNEFQLGPDPILAAIDQVKDAWRDHCAAATAADDAQVKHGLDSLQYGLAEAAQDEVSDRHCRVLDAFMATVPTTLPGVVAYLDFLNHVAAFRDVAIESWQQETILAALKAAVLRYVDLPVSAAPIAEAVPVTRELLENYDAWLVHEHRRLNAELGNCGCVRANIPGSDYHMPGSGFPETPSPSTRAARVLAAVGCPLAWEA